MNKFKEFLSKANKVVKSKNAIPMCDNILLKDGRLSVTDSIHVLVSNKLIVDDISILVNFKEFYAFVSNCDFTFSISQDGDTLRVNSKHGSVDLQGDIGVQHYIHTEGEYAPLGQLKSEHISVINKSLAYASGTDKFPNLYNVNMYKDGTILGSSAHMASIRQCSRFCNTDFMITPKVVQLLPKQVNVYKSEDFYKYATKEYTLYQAIDHEIKNINYKNVVYNESGISFRLSVADIQDKLKYLSSLGEELCRIVIDEKPYISNLDSTKDSAYKAPLKVSKVFGVCEIMINVNMLLSVIKNEGYKVLDVNYSDSEDTVKINKDIIIKLAK